jgi:Methyltransferase FkbM domain
MSNKNKSLYRMLVPKFIRSAISDHQIKKQIFEHYGSLPKGSVNDEEKLALNYLRSNKLCVFPYQFQHNYNREDISVFKDDKLNLKYVMCDGKRLYFKRTSSSRGIKRNYNFLLIEQDLKSPHRYLTNDFNVGRNDILVDVGAAEGNLSLELIEKVKKVYLFETDPLWIEALEATFSPWKDKVEIINKFVSNKNDEKNVSLDQFFADKEPFNFLKVDAEGAESDILEGSEKIMSKGQQLKLALCCYHKPQDGKEFYDKLTKKEFSTTYSPGYMIFTEPKSFSPPYLRKGVLRASREKDSSNSII